MKRRLQSPFYLIIIAFSLLFLSCSNDSEFVHEEHEELEEGEKPDALDALDTWWAYRAYPGNTINMQAYSRAFEKLKEESDKNQTTFNTDWEAKGPKNFGGRTLCLEFNPQNPNTVYAGSASGGLWRSRTAGIGANAWEYIPTGYPVLGVSAIVVNPMDSNTLYIGTGEVYNYQNTGSSTIDRTTRGTYGIGILKSVDGGISWTKSLDWSYDDLRGIQDLKMNPQDTSILLAATSEGLYKTVDAGNSWQIKDSVLMTTDIEYYPGDTSMVFIASGNSGTPGSGIYKSVDGGESFFKLTNGLPLSYTGKTLLHIAPQAPHAILASVANQFQQIGLFRSTDLGSSWTNINSSDISLYQGWFSHDVAVMPSNPSHIVWVGVDAYQSTDNGNNFVRKSYWYNWDFSATPIGGPEGPSDYVHADIHRIYVKPGTDSTFYLATDGGIFISFDGGNTFSGHNGQYQTTQFYADVSNATIDTNFFIGGLQDNSTTIYEGNPEWRRVIGGDGMSTAIDPSDDNIVYATAQRLNIFKSTDKGQSFFNIAPGSSSANPTAFNGPYAIAPNSPLTIYAGRNIMYKSINGGNNWQIMNGGVTLNGQLINKIEVDPNNADLIYCSTVASDLSAVDLMKSSDGGQSWSSVFQNLPNRIIMDIEISPTNSNEVYVVLSGFGMDHIYKTIDGGSSWTSSSANLPDVPHNCILIDDLNSDILYAGNDFGIYYSTDAGLNWQTFNTGLDDATLIMSLTQNTISRKLRIGTHGKGMYEREMIDPFVSGFGQKIANEDYFSIYPNPASDYIFISPNNISGEFQVRIFDLKGNEVFKKNFRAINQPEKIDLKSISNGIYFIELKQNELRNSRKLLIE